MYTRFVEEDADYGLSGYMFLFVNTSEQEGGSCCDGCRERFLSAQGMCCLLLQALHLADTSLYFMQLSSFMPFHDFENYSFK